MNRRTFTLGGLVAAALFVVGCSDQGLAPRQPLVLAGELDGYAGFVRQGASPDSAGQVIVFFDPLCPYCLRLWDESKDTQTPQLWIPVAIVQEGRGADMGGWLLQSGTPDEDFGRFKQATLAGGAVEIHASQDALEQVAKNTRRFLETGQRSVPTLVFSDAAGRTQVHRGALDRDSLLAMIGEK